MINPQTIRIKFPIISHHKDLVYLDSAATALKPQVVINAEREYMEEYSVNIARGLYPLAETATEKFEAVRDKVARFIGARSTKEIVFTSGTTASINLTARLLASHIKPTDNIVITEMEHHSNFLPWKELALRQDAELRIVSLSDSPADEGTLDLDTLKNSIDEHTKIVAFSAVSNVLGTINPVAEIVQAIKNINPDAIVLVDAAQAVGHMPLDVSVWNADLVAFSAHKMFGPTGVGVLYGKQELLEKLYPTDFGGGMVLNACATHPTYKDIPHRFEAGTPNIGGVIAFGAAISFIEEIGIENIRARETDLTHYALKKLEETFDSDIRIIGPQDAAGRGGIIAFTLRGVHPHDIAHLLGEADICVRAGEHCAAPLHRSLSLDATTRISFSVYNDEGDIDRLIEELKNIFSLFNHQSPNSKIQGNSNDQ